MKQTKTGKKEETKRKTAEKEAVKRNLTDGKELEGKVTERMEKKQEEKKKAESRSILRTKNTLKRGLENLMQTRSVQQITVKELTDSVNLNRGTFYLHYRDIYDLLEDLENEIMDSFQEIVDQHSAQSMNGRPYPLLRDIFAFIRVHAVFCKTLLGQNVEYTFTNKLKELIREKCFYDWKQVYREIDSAKYELLSAYVLSGCIGVIEHWLFGGMKESLDEVAFFTETVVLDGIRRFAGTAGREMGDAGVWKSEK